MNKYLFILVAAFTACNTNNDPVVIPASPGATIDARVGGPDQPNQVYVDLSSEVQTAIRRSAWDLGFYTGSDAKVILNAAAEVMARQIPKSDFADIVPEDYEGFSTQTTVDAVFSNLFGPPPYPDWFMESASWIDSPDGNLSETAINLSSGNIYYINRGFTPEQTPRGEYLVKITSSGNTYSIQYVVPGETNVATSTINKNETHNYTYFDFDSGEVTIAPAKDSWDIAFTTYMEKLDVGGGTLIPYRYQDYVIQNRSGIETGVVEIGENDNILERFETFTLDDAANVFFSTAVNSIGSSWRTVASPTPGSITGVKEDRFYIVKDNQGNKYKLLFTQLLNSSGERGHPQISYELLQ